MAGQHTLGWPLLTGDARIRYASRVIAAARVGVDTSWSNLGGAAQNLQNPLPANTYARALLQKKDAQGNYQDQGTALYAIP